MQRMASAVREAVLFKSVVTNEYVRPIVESTPLNGPKYGGLPADGKGDPKMYLEKASNGYHIKSHETNKYWQVKSKETPWITADADADGDAHAEHILFDIVPAIPTDTFGTTTTVRLLHQHSECYAYLQEASSNYPYCLRLSDHPKTVDNDSKDVFVYEKFK